MTDAAALPAPPTPTSPPPAGATRLLRGRVLHFLADPGNALPPRPGSTELLEDGGLWIEAGRVRRCGPWAEIAAEATAEAAEQGLSGPPVDDHSGRLILPGFVDTHVHYPQTDVIASPGHGLLDWLDRYTFPAERHFADPAWGAEVAQFFCDELLRNGTTTALVFGTVHPQSVDAFFAVAQARDLRMVAGKVLMDRLCPDFLADTAQSGYDDSLALIQRWHGVGRLCYALTPRFAITSSEAQLEATGALAQRFPDLTIQSHVAENLAEVAKVRELFPRSRSYLDVYDGYGLLRPGAVYAHCIHLDAEDRQRMVATGTTAAFSPTSNLFLGSGLFDLGQALDEGVNVGIASDVGGGTSFSLLRTLAAGYQVAHLKGCVLSPLRAFYLATLAGARALGVAPSIGNFEPGKEADAIVLDPACTPLIARRMARAESLEEQLFAWQTLGDDRAISHTYVHGRLAWQRPG
ncbi:MAG TPA: guanine deaminase [Burkholderiaceae bacterium]|nr:guanine deaminase [Burkholderiaceae bacterium]HNG79520.1 guanine deaminase [Burkholderiaceae bacterium]